MRIAEIPMRLLRTPVLVTALAAVLAACVAPERPALPNVAVDRDPYRLGTGAVTDVRETGPNALAGGGPGASPAVKRGLQRSVLAYPTGDPRTSLIVCERVTPASVVVAEEFAYELRVRNVSGVTLERVTVTERMPESVTVRAALPEPLVAEPGRLTWSFAALSPGQERLLEIRATQHDAAAVIHTASVTCEPVLVSRTQVVPPRMRVHLTAPAEGLRCEPIPLRVTVTNTGQTHTRNVRFDLPLPEGLLSNLGGTTAYVDVPPLELGSSFTAIVRLTASSAGSYTLRSSDGGLGAHSNLVTTTVREPRLAATLTAPPEVHLGAEVPVSATLRNDGDGIARDAEVQLFFSTGPSPGAAFVRGSEGALASADSVRWNLGDLHPGETRELEATLAVLAPGGFAPHLTARAACAEEVSAETTADVLDAAQALLEITGAEDPIPVGRQHSYEVRLVNSGRDHLDGVRVVARLSGSGRLVEATGPSAPTEVEGELHFPLLEGLEPGAEVHWRIAVRASEPGTGELAVEVSAPDLPLGVDRRARTDYYE